MTFAFPSLTALPIYLREGFGRCAAGFALVFVSAMIFQYDMKRMETKKS